MTPLDEPAALRYLVRFGDQAALDPLRVGPKFAGLARAARAGLPVPPAVAVSTADNKPAARGGYCFYVDISAFFVRRPTGLISCRSTCSRVCCHGQVVRRSIASTAYYPGN